MVLANLLGWKKKDIECLVTFSFVCLSIGSFNIPRYFFQANVNVRLREKQKKIKIYCKYKNVYGALEIKFPFYKSICAIKAASDSICRKLIEKRKVDLAQNLRKLPRVAQCHFPQNWVVVRDEYQGNIMLKSASNKMQLS